MKEYWQKFITTAPMPFGGALLAAFAFWGFVAWDQSYWWETKEDYGFGWLVPAFVAFVIYDRWGKITADAKACAAPGSPRADGWAARWLQRLAMITLCGGGGVFLLGALYRAGVGPSYPGTLAITLGSAAILMPLLFLNVPESASPKLSRETRLRDDPRVRLTVWFFFPVMVWLVSAPMLSVVEQNLSLFLLGKVTAVVFFVFDLLGLPIEQQGNVLVLPTGSVGVADACSGIRSLTACLFAGSFLASVFLDSLGKKIALVVSSMLFAVFTNLLRSLFLTAWAYNHGPDAIEGFVHDAAGYAVLGLTVIGLLCLLPIFNMHITFSDHDDEDHPDDGPNAPEAAR